MSYRCACGTVLYEAREAAFHASCAPVVVREDTRKAAAPLAPGASSSLDSDEPSPDPEPPPPAEDTALILRALDGQPVIVDVADALAGRLRSGEVRLFDLASIREAEQRLMWARARAEAAERERDLLLLSPENRLDGYRELGAKCAAIEAERDAARAHATLLRGALEGIADGLVPDKWSEWVKTACDAALAATPAGAGRLWVAMETVVAEQRERHEGCGGGTPRCATCRMLAEVDAARAALTATQEEAAK